MSIRFAAPVLLLCLPVLGVTAMLLRSRVATESRQSRISYVLRWGAAGLVAVALAQPQLRLSPRPPTVLVLDASASTDERMQTIEQQWATAVADSSCAQPCRVVRVDDGVQVIPDAPGALVPPAQAPVASDLGAGLQAAVGLAPAGGRVVLLSESSEADPAATEAADEARAEHVQIDSVLLSDPARRDAAVTEMQAPAVVHKGDEVPLRITVRSTVAAPAQLDLTRDGVSVGSQRVNLSVGDNPMLVSYTATAGWHSFQARILLPGDDVPENDALGATVDAVGEPRVLVVNQGRSGPATTMLDRLGFSVTAIAARSFPQMPGAFRNQDAVVLDDVPENAFSRSQIAALSTAVRAGGLGLVALGGPHSFSLGGYAHSALDQLLPVQSLVPGNLQRRNVAIQLVLDHSGSMIDLAGGVPKIEMVHVAGTQVARFVAAHKDDLGVIDFDIAPHVLVPMQSVASRRAEQSAIARVEGLQANGGTNIYAALQAGLGQLKRSNAPDKHMILMTDGNSEPENYVPLLAALKRDHIAVATVALGTDADKSLLYRIAHATGGDYYYTDDAHRLPAIFARETRLDVKPVLVTGRLRVTVGSDSPVIRSLGGRELPQLSGNVIAALANGAQADLLAVRTASQLDPVLAQRQNGAGRVVAFTPGLDQPWAGAWAAQTSLWNDVVRWVERAAVSSPLDPTIIDGSTPVSQIDLAGAVGAAELGAPAIDGTITSTGGHSYRLDFSPAAPDIYDAPVPAVPEGIYSFTTSASGRGEAPEHGLLAVPYPLQYAPRPPDATSLGAVTALTGGRELAPDDPGVVSADGWRSLWWILALAGLVLAAAGFLHQALRAQQEYDDTVGYRVTRAAAQAEVVDTPISETPVAARR